MINRLSIALTHSRRKLGCLSLSSCGRCCASCDHFEYIVLSRRGAQAGGREERDYRFSSRENTMGNSTSPASPPAPLDKTMRRRITEVLRDQHPARTSFSTVRPALPGDGAPSPRFLLRLLPPPSCWRPQNPTRHHLLHLHRLRFLRLRGCSALPLGRPLPWQPAAPASP